MTFQEHVIDYYRYIVGLSTGSVVVLATFAKHVTAPGAKSLAIAAIVSLTLTIVAGTTAMTLMSWYYVEGAALDDWLSAIMMPLTYVTWIGFLVSVVTLSATAIGVVRAGSPKSGPRIE